MLNLPSTNDPLRRRFAACLLGGAIGDALGFPIEFLSTDQILERHGSDGLREFIPEGGLARVSDDTQMTYLTLLSLVRHGHDQDPLTFQKELFDIYREWGRIQRRSIPAPPDYPVFLTKLRSPGFTCMKNLTYYALPSSLERPRNDSKGCGGIMRVAPIGFLDIGPEKVALLAILASSCTHGHPLGYLPSAVQACAVQRLVFHPETSVRDAVGDAVETVGRLLRSGGHPELSRDRVLEEWGLLVALLEKAVCLAENPSDVRTDIEKLGQGWVAEETLAIAVYCSIRFENDFRSAICSSANFSGDSDSCAAVTGNLLGAKTDPDVMARAFDVDILESADELVSLVKML
ncbi:MAG: ADP-ribosylglycohydrolase family protein [archaeon]|nr:ADP-ribosylglycohydrolase family protein [archaeon]